VFRYLQLVSDYISSMRLLDYLFNFMTSIMPCPYTRLSIETTENSVRKVMTDINGNPYDIGPDAPEQETAPLIEAAIESIMRKYNFLTIEDNNKAFREELEYFGEKSHAKIFGHEPLAK
jgi:hypothetical protein